jgi:hypothetical protein
MRFPQSVTLIETIISGFRAVKGDCCLSALRLSPLLAMIANSRPLIAEYIQINAQKFVLDDRQLSDYTSRIFSESS